MSTPELEKALAAARWKGIEKTVAEVIARMLQVDPGTVMRVIYAWECARDCKFSQDSEHGRREDLFDGIEEGERLDNEVAKAIYHAAVRGMRRARIRWEMEHGCVLEVPFNKLVPHTEAGKLCNGCIWQFECVRDSLSTPQQCWNGKWIICQEQPEDGKTRSFQLKYAVVTPIKLDDTHVTVTSAHPRGTFKVSIMDVRL